MSIVTRPLTYDDLAQMPADGNRYEVIDGELVVTPAPVKAHQKLLYRITRLIGDYVEERQLGEVYFAPVDVRFFMTDIVQPDLLFIRRDRLGIYESGSIVEGAPDLVIEVLSPSTRMVDLVPKAALYARGGVSEYWVADPDEHSLVVYVLREGRYEPVPAEAGKVRSFALPGLVVDLGALFASL